MRLNTFGAFAVTISTLAVSLVSAWARADHLAVHLGYVVPQERSGQAEAVENIEALMLATQAWYEEQMDRWGFGPKTFRFEGGGAPMVHAVTAPTSAVQIRADIWAQTISSAQGAGLPVWTSGQVWFLVSDAHEQQPNGAILGNTALGGGGTSGNDAGTAMLGGDTIFRLHPNSLTNTLPYHGQIVPEIGPYPLVYGTSFGTGEQNTFSSIGSSVQGAAVHELGHAFGLPHNLLNDANFNGNVMGNGLRGFRGVFEPDLFPQDDMRLSYASALILSTSRYFNYDDTFTDNVRPSLSVNTFGRVEPVNGLLEINFTGSDPSGLSAAVLVRNGDIIGQMPLSGTSVNETFATPYYEPSQTDQYEVLLYDLEGNRQGRTVSIAPSAVPNRAPRPFITMNHSIVRIGQAFALSATASSDLDNTGLLRVEWDFDGDGVFDTTPSTNLTRFTAFNTPGQRMVYARITDAGGLSTVSAPMAVRVLGQPGDADLDNDVDDADFDAWKLSFGERRVPYFGADFNGNGWIDAADYTIWVDRPRVTVPREGAGAAVPEPCSLLSSMLAVSSWIGRRRRCI